MRHEAASLVGPLNIDALLAPAVCKNPDGKPARIQIKEFSFKALKA